MTDALKVKNPLYPLVCLGAAVVVLIVGLLYAKSPWFVWMLPALLALNCLFGLWRPAVRCALVFVPVSLAFAGMSFLFNRSGEVALQMFLRVMLVGLSAVPLISLPQINLTRCLTQLHCPRVITLGMLIAVRFVPVLKDEVRQVREAMRTRGVRASLWNVRCLYRAFLIPLMMRVLNISDTLSLSLETRGFELSGSPATVYRLVRFTARDGLYAGAVAAGVVAFIILA